MNLEITAKELIKFGLDSKEASIFNENLTTLIKSSKDPIESWQILSSFLVKNSYPFPLHLFLFKRLFPNWPAHPETAPVWIPKADFVKTTNLFEALENFQIKEVKDFHRFTVSNYEKFWAYMLKKLELIFRKAPEKICDLSEGATSPKWFPGASLNIIESCFTANKNDTALIYEEKDKLCKLSYGELNELSNRIANGLTALQFKAGDAIAIAMPMHYLAVAIYLGIIKMGGVVVSIADSFSHEEIALRLKMAKAKALFTQDLTEWGEKNLALYEKIIDRNKANTPPLTIIVLPKDKTLSLNLRKEDLAFYDFLSSDKDFTPHSLNPMSPLNILFSSGTTATPKAILWNHTTAIKAASDAFLHQNIKPGDILNWPTNLGWMMGPWLIFAALINKASIALYTGVPKDRAFGKFIERAKVTMLGVVPTLVATWRESQCMEGLNWQAIKCFSSTGECSNAEDMFYLISLAGYKPVIEYCGGTEIGGAYVSSTLLQNNYPSLFSTPTMGMDFTILDQEGREAKEGEVAIIAPALGLSTTLLNRDHYQVYFAGMPSLADGRLLRRHGDQIKQFKNGYYEVLGRSDDTMNLGGIKISSAEIERALTGIPGILEVAAIGIAPANNGPQQLVIYAATASTNLDKETVLKEMQKRLSLHLNPLFKIDDVIFTEALPKTASNKIMRRILRKKYLG